MITAQTADQIRDDLLASRAAIHDEQGEALDTRQFSPDYVEASALGVLLAALERQAEQAPTQILPDTASGRHLDAHGLTTGDLSRSIGESDADYRARILAWWAQRTGAGSGEDVVAWAEATSVCDEAYAYPLLQPGSTSTTRYGCWTLVALGPAQGSSASNTRLLAAGDLAKVKKYIEGEADAEGNTVSGEELRPIASVHGNWAVEAVTETTQNVDVQVEASPTTPFPWSGSFPIVAMSGTTTGADVVGDASALVGLDVLVNIGTGSARGGYVRATIASASFGGVDTTVTFVDELAAAPSGTMYPAPPFFELAQEAVFDLFDALGPGDTSVTARRWPTELERGRATLYTSRIIQSLYGVDGIKSVSLVTPSGNVTPAAKALVTLGTFLVRSL